MKFFSKKNKDEDIILEIDRDQSIDYSGNEKIAPSHKLTVDEVLGTKEQPSINTNSKSALNSLRQRMLHIDEADSSTSNSATVINPNAHNPITESSSINITNKEIADKKDEVKIDKKSLVEKCKPFITDDSGNDTSNNFAPLYKLESVAEILENNRKKSIDRLAEQYDIQVDDLGKTESKENTELEAIEFVNTTATPTEEKEVIEINAFFENVQSSVPFSVSEIETEIEFSDYNNENDLQDSSTITFTPVAEQSVQKSKIVVSSNTQNIDLTGEIAPIDDYENINSRQIELEKSEFEDFVPDEEIENPGDIKKHIRSISILKRRRFLTTTVSVLITLILAFMKLPFMSGAVLGNTVTTMIICTALTFIAIVLNCDMFISLKNIFTKKSVSDIPPAIASIFVLAYAIAGIITKEIIIDILLLFNIILTIRSLGKFKKESYMLSNLKQISKSGTKNAVKLIDDPTVTFAMAKNTIEGDTLIAASQKCDNISDFIKYSSFGAFLNGRMPIITILSIVVAAISGFAAANYFGGLIYGLYAVVSVLCFASLPSIFFINDFPLYAAAKKLNKKGSTIFGSAGAAHLEMANAIMLNSIDIFPSKTVTLHQMKVLSDNDLDKTILRAASLTDCLNSPLTHIFKTIAGESNIDAFPDSDTIKYEERMGISGWVDDELLFIGNRTLMQAHGIDVPDIEVDKKILRNGYFPVYVASSDKVCALLIVQYSVDPEVAYELRRLTKIGVTLLVNNTDPNINEEMICDYLGLYDDSVMIMTNAGYHMYKNTAIKKESVSAPAAYRFGNISIARIINCANKIKRSNTLITVLYVISAILGIMIFAYSSFAGSGTLIRSSTVLLYSLICTAVSYILYLIQKP